MTWLIDQWFGIGRRIGSGAPEGSCKTTLGASVVISVASGKPFLGFDVAQGPALVLDEETPPRELEKLYDRLAMGVGYRGYQELPITIRSMEGFRFGHKTQLAPVLTLIDAIQPKIIVLDSYLAMMPSGRQGLGENNSESGIAVRDDLNKMLARSDCCTLLATHSPKPVVDWTIEQYEKAQMQSIVRGHGSIVGEAIDTGLAIKKISERPDPLRFAIITKARRGAVPMSDTVYAELKEEAYGEGWARLERIQPVPPPPSRTAKDLFQYFKDGSPHTAREIRSGNALSTTKENRAAVDELLVNKVIFNHQAPFTYRLNRNYRTEVDAEYLRKLT